MKKIINLIISTRTMAVLLFVYAFAMAYATFVENDYGTPTAKALIYEAKWFELIMFLLILNFIGNTSRYRLWRREKWPILLFHLAFVFIFIGGAITRYISYEGIMHIREGEMSNEVITDKNFFKIQIEEKGERLNYQDVPYMLASDKPVIAKILPHNFSATYDFHGKRVSVKQLDYVQRKKDSLIVNPKGTEYFHFVVAGETGREDVFVKSGEAKNINGQLITYNRPIDGAIEIKSEEGNLFIKTPVESTYMVMASQATGGTKANEFAPLSLRSLYTIKDLRIVVPFGLRKGDLMYFEGDKKKDKDVADLFKVEVQGPKTKLIVDLPVEKGNANLFKQINIDGLNIILGFGPKVYTTPFSLKLDDFVMETYPGSDSPSAYESHVQIVDEGKQTPYKIYMNHVLNHKGYRFFQASFDPDRQGTVLSVNHDWWGTLVSYFGYALLFIGMFVTFFWKGSHFSKLNEMLKSMSKKKAAGALLIFLSLGFINAQEIDMHGTDGAPKVHQGSQAATQAHGVASNDTTTAPSTSAHDVSTARPFSSMRIISADEIIARNKISKEHAEKFGYLMVQSFEGRIIPMNTQALDVLRKIYKSDSFKGTDGKKLDANQWFLSVNTDTETWTMVPVIKVGDKGGEALKVKTKANEDGYTTLMNLFPVNPATGTIQFVLEDDYNEAFARKPAEQSKYDREVIAINERVQIFNEFFSGQFMRIIPVKNDPNNRWNSWLDYNFEPDMEAQKVMAPYFLSVADAQNTGNWSKANEELKKISDYQHTWAKNVVPSPSKISLEVFMNKVNINFKLLIFYTVIGGILMILGFIDLFKPSRRLKNIIKIIIGIGVVGYFLHFLGLIARWYLSGHAPWSNGYEAIIFISWVGITAGLALYKNSNALIPSAGFVVAVIMMGFAHGGSALDPQITPLVPVLKSYWLIIHVAIITASYGFFALSLIIAIIVLLFYIISGKKMFDLHEKTTIKELTIVSEMSLSIGLFALVVGNFLGGIWANESWGRYWSWDPKETWAFISIMVYVLVIHLRLVPGLRGRWLFHVAAMFAFASIVMTYFGVNYYLSGLHSYAAGDPIPVPAWVYIGTATMFILAIASYFKTKAFAKTK